MNMVHLYAPTNKNESILEEFHMKLQSTEDNFLKMAVSDLLWVT